MVCMYGMHVWYACMVCMYYFMHVSMYACMHVCAKSAYSTKMSTISVYIYIYIYIYIYTYICILEQRFAAVGTVCVKHTPESHCNSDGTTCRSRLRSRGQHEGAGYYRVPGPRRGGLLSLRRAWASVSGRHLQAKCDRDAGVPMRGEPPECTTP